MTELKWPWLAMLLLVGLVVLLVLWMRRPARPRDALPVAHTERLRRIPRFRQLARRQLYATGLRTVAALVLAAGAVLLVARPVRVEVKEPDRSARDIELCLDVSSSMDRWDRQIIDEFRNLVHDLDGERIGLTIFNATAVTVFPLTDDYEFIGDRLDEAEAAFGSGKYQYFVGTIPLVHVQGFLVPDPTRASQIGDGLASCVQRFDATESARGRAIVLASDNAPAGKPLFTLAEAADHAARRHVVVYGMAPPAIEGHPDRSAAFEAATAKTGGSLSVLQQDSDVNDIVDGIQRLERARIPQRPTPTEVDDPEAAFWLACSGLVALIAASLLGRPA